MKKIIRMGNHNKELWRKYTEKNQGTRIPHTLEFMEVVKKSYKNCEDYYFFIKSKKIEAIFPFFLVKSRLFGNRVISQPFIDFGGPLGEFDEKFIQSLIKDIKEKIGDSLKHIEIRLNNFIPNYKKIEEILTNEGFEKVLKRYQFILKLEDEKTLWDNFSRVTRKGIKKAKKSELIMKKIRDEEELKAFYELYLKNMRNFGTPQHSYNFFLNLFNIMKDNFMGLNCYREGRLIGSLVGFYSKNYMHAAYNFSERDYLIYRPNDLLYWKMITWARKKGIKYFDFGQCEVNAKEGSHAAGIYNFKSKWNGVLYERPYFYYSFGDEKRKNSEKKEKYKKMVGIWKNLPVTLIKKIGPKLASELAL